MLHAACMRVPYRCDNCSLLSITVLFPAPPARYDVPVVTGTDGFKLTDPTSVAAYSLASDPCQLRHHDMQDS